MREDNVIFRFLYQRYWTRVFCLIPAFFALSMAEYKLYGHLISTQAFLVLSVVIMFAFVYLVFRPIGKWFVREGAIVIEGDTISIIKNGKEILKTPAKSIKSVQIEKLEIYQSQFLKMTLSGEDVQQVFYSDEITKGNAKEGYCSFHEIADYLKEHFCCSNASDR